MLFTDNEISLAEKIILYFRREIAKKFTYLNKAIFYHSVKATDKIKLMGADYSTLFYNPKDIIEMYKKNPLNIEKAIMHCILHCILLHPSFSNCNDDLFSVASDSIVNAMLENEYNSHQDDFRTLIKENNAGTTAKLYNAVLSNRRLNMQLSALCSGCKTDDHSVWHTSSEQINADIKEQSGSSIDNKKSINAQVKIPGTFRNNSTIMNQNQNMSVSVGNSKAESAWKEMFINASSECSMMYGNQNGNLFCCLTPPDRFSRFSSIEYLKRFVREEIAEDDPETLDMILYIAGLELYEDMPIVEWNEIRERINPSDIIIAIDMSGSCDGDVTANFLRQIYTLFNEMDIRGFVNIHVLFFDTEILGEKIIRTREDAERLVKEYKAWGFGGTDFRCVFSYADNFPQLSGGRQLKGLFFFSDAMGSFPDDKKPYKTTFFVPDSQYSENESYDFVPDWIELIHYNDN